MLFLYFLFQHSKHFTKKQIHILIAHYTDVLSKKISSLAKLTPDIALNTSHLYDYSTYLPRYTKWSAHDELIQKLPNLVDEENELSCDHALTLLNIYSDFYFGNVSTFFLICLVNLAYHILY